MPFEQQAEFAVVRVRFGPPPVPVALPAGAVFDPPKIDADLFGYSFGVFHMVNDLPMQTYNLVLRPEGRGVWAANSLRIGRLMVAGDDYLVIAEPVVI